MGGPTAIRNRASSPSDLTRSRMSLTLKSVERVLPICETMAPPTRLPIAFMSSGLGASAFGVNADGRSLSFMPAIAEVLTASVCWPSVTARSRKRRRAGSLAISVAIWSRTSFKVLGPSGSRFVVEHPSVVAGGFHGKVSVAGVSSVWCLLQSVFFFSNNFLQWHFLQWHFLQWHFLRPAFSSVAGLLRWPVRRRSYLSVVGSGSVSAGGCSFIPGAFLGFRCRQPPLL